MINPTGGFRTYQRVFRGTTPVVESAASRLAAPAESGRHVRLRMGNPPPEGHRHASVGATPVVYDEQLMWKRVRSCSC